MLALGNPSEEIEYYEIPCGYIREGSKIFNQTPFDHLEVDKTIITKFQGLGNYPTITDSYSYKGGMRISGDSRYYLHPELAPRLTVETKSRLMLCGCETIGDNVFQFTLDYYPEYPFSHYTSCYASRTYNVYDKGWYWVFFSGFMSNLVLDYEHMPEITSAAQLEYLAKFQILLNEDRRIMSELPVYSGNLNRYVVTTPAYSFKSDSSDLSFYHAVASRMSEVASDIITSSHIRDDQIFNKLSFDAVSKVKYLDINSCLYLKELSEILTSTNSWVNTLTDSVFNHTAKDFSNALLSSEYGLRLTYRDSKEIINELCTTIFGFFRSNKYRSRGQTTATTTYPTDIVVDCNYTVKVGNLDADLKGLMVKLFQYDLYPEMGNAWDMIPYSFVVDWFINIGDMFDAIDRENLFLKLPIDYSISTRTYHFCLPTDPVDSNIAQCTFYTRGIRSGGVSPLFYDPEIFSGVPTHIPELSALIIQRM